MVRRGGWGMRGLEKVPISQCDWWLELAKGFALVEISAGMWWLGKNEKLEFLGFWVLSGESCL